MSTLIVETVTTPDTNTDLTINPNGTGKTVVDGKLDMNGGELILDADADTSITADTDDQIDFRTGGTDAMHINSSGDVGIGASDPNHGSHDRALLVSNTGSGARSAVEIEGNSSNANGTVTFLNNGSKSCSIDSRGTGTMTLNGASSEYMRIDSTSVLIGKTSAGAEFAGTTIGATGFITITRDGANPLFVNRETSDGGLVELRQDNTTEGSITVSGGTVSFNGGHLSRWSRLVDASRPDTLLKGTVMSNLDDMIVWTGEDNEQLNHTKISDTEGDINAAGVFVSWDDDDEDYEDFYLAMTGDMVIRIAQDTTVARGDLLMSAGDGTAKPQGDGYVQDKTIAKVTSTTVSHTYDDGSYLVPCVLMAC